MKKARNVDKTKVTLLWPRNLDLENIVGKPFLQAVKARPCARETHAYCSLREKSLSATQVQWVGSRKGPR